MKIGVVKEFRGEYYFLSNYYTAPMQWRGIEFQSSEQAFAYAKATFVFNRSDMLAACKAVLSAPTPGEAKRIGRRVKINVEQWDQHKVQWMREIIHAKFKTVDGLAGQLINTGAMLLVEGNDWGDTFWGRCDGKGFNTLGALLMEERGYWLHGKQH